jgi:hypothetical protein
VEIVSEEIYDYANCIHCEKKLLSASVNECEQQAHMNEKEDLVETQLWLEYSFPKIHTSALEKATDQERHRSVSFNDKRGKLIKTPRENFVLVRIVKRENEHK